MSVLRNVVFIVVGVVLIVAPLDAAMRTFVLPRGVPVAFSRAIFRSVRSVFNVITNRARDYEARDHVMAFYAPIALLLLPTVFLLSIFLGFTFIYVTFEHHGWRDAFTTSGSSLFTLGFERPPHFAMRMMSFGEAALGLALLALLIAYLPTIYGAFSRRETAVTGLAVRAGAPPTPRDLFVRAHRSGFLDQLDDTWRLWELWFQELSETHTSLAMLTFFRSPKANVSWITASGAVLDAAALRYAILDVPWTPAAATCIRSGYLALRDIAEFFGIPFDADPAPDDPISVAREEFDEVCDQLAAAGVPLKADRDQAWRDFAGWRVNYDIVLTTLAGLVMAPYAPWSSDRSARRSHRPPLRHRRARRDAPPADRR